MAHKYYEAYEERYKAIHRRGVSWSSDQSTPIVMALIRKYNVSKDTRILEIGCGEGRDSKTVLAHDFDLLATDISPEAIRYCQTMYPQYKEHFEVMDCLSTDFSEHFGFIYAIAVIHMLVLDEDRDRFYRFIHDHLADNGIALICSMGDGKTEMQSNIGEAFTLQERNHETGKILVAGTSCRMVSFDTFNTEITGNDLQILESGITNASPDFNSLMYAVVRRRNSY